MQCKKIVQEEINVPRKSVFMKIRLCFWNIDLILNVQYMSYRTFCLDITIDLAFNYEILRLINLSHKIKTMANVETLNTSNEKYLEQDSEDMKMNYPTVSPLHQFPSQTFWIRKQWVLSSNPSRQSSMEASTKHQEKTHNTWYQWINFTKTFQLIQKLKEILMIHINSSTRKPTMEYQYGTSCVPQRTRRPQRPQERKGLYVVWLNLSWGSKVE